MSIMCPFIKVPCQYRNSPCLPHCQVRSVPHTLLNNAIESFNEKMKKKSQYQPYKPYETQHTIKAEKKIEKA